MPDIEKQIAEWRRQMLAAGIKSPVPLEELESHLRDDMEQRMQAGSSAQAAFDAAVKRLGRAEALKSEFKRGRFDIRFLSPFYLRVFCFLAALLLLSMIWAFPGEASLAQRGLGAAVTSLFVLYISGLPFFYRQLFARRNKRMRKVLQLGNWIAVGCPVLALLDACGVISLGTVVAMILWPPYAAHFATCLACANYEREYVETRAVKLAGS
jgi:hypothetical protein